MRSATKRRPVGVVTPQKGAPLPYPIKIDWIDVAGTAHDYLSCYVKASRAGRFDEFMSEQIVASLTSVFELECALAEYTKHQRRRKFKAGQPLRGPTSPYAAFCMIVDGVIASCRSAGFHVKVSKGVDWFYWRPRQEFRGRYGDCKVGNITKKHIFSGAYLTLASPPTWVSDPSVDQYIHVNAGTAPAPAGRSSNE